jgi:hypothetical protein
MLELELLTTPSTLYVSHTLSNSITVSDLGVFFLYFYSSKYYDCLLLILVLLVCLNTMNSKSFIQCSVSY